MQRSKKTAIRSAFEERDVMEFSARQWPDSFGLDVCGPDHLAPLLGFGGEELAKFGRLTGKRCIAQIAESRFHLGAHETRIGLPVEPFDDVRRRIPGGAQAKPRARLVARHEITEYRNVRQD